MLNNRQKPAKEMSLYMLLACLDEHTDFYFARVGLALGALE